MELSARYNDVLYSALLWQLIGLYVRIEGNGNYLLHLVVCSGKSTETGLCETSKTEQRNPKFLEFKRCFALDVLNVWMHYVFIKSFSWEKMTAIKHALQRDIFTPNDERLLSIVNVCKAGKKKRNCFLCATGM